MPHWKCLINPDFLGAYAIDDSKDMVLTIKEIRSEIITGAGGKKEECPVMYWVEDEKPMICNRTNLKMMSRLFSTPDYEDWYGKRIALYADRNVRFGGEIVEGLRIRPSQPTAQEVECSECGKIIADSGKYKAASIIKSSIAKHGVPLCFECYSAKKEAADASDKG